MFARSYNFHLSFLFVKPEFICLVGVLQNKERAELIGRISLFCWMGSSACVTLVEVDSFNSFVVLKSLHVHSDVFTAERNSQPSELILPCLFCWLWSLVGLAYLCSNKTAARALIGSRRDSALSDTSDIQFLTPPPFKIPLCRDKNMNYSSAFIFTDSLLLYLLILNLFIRS